MTMNLPEAGVLFVGEFPALSASVARVLKSWGRECRYAATCEQAMAALEQRGFRLVLSKAKLPDGSARQLISTIEKNSGWLFVSFPVEDGCWWIPVMEKGQTRMEAVALHSREFSKVLLNVVKALETPAPRETAAEVGGSLVDVTRRPAYATGI